MFNMFNKQNLNIDKNVSTKEIFNLILDSKKR